MRMWKRLKYTLCGLMIATSTVHGASPAKTAVAQPREPQMPALIEQFTADSMALNRTYFVVISPVRMERLERFYAEKQAMLAAIDFDAISQEDKVDYLLLKNRLSGNLHQLAIEKKQVEEMQPLLPFANTIEVLMEGKRLKIGRAHV